MRRWRSSALIIALAAVSLAQTPTQLVTPEIRRVGDKLACLCGVCKNTVATCAMLQCEYSHPARMRIAKMQAAGKSDAEIIDATVKEKGLQALATPPARGFSLLVWVMPFIALAFGLGAIYLFVRRFHGQRAIASVPPIHPDVLARYHDSIEKDMAKLD